MLYRGILDTALECIVTMGADGRVLEFNPAAERMFGFSRQEAVGKELAELTAFILRANSNFRNDQKV